MQPCRMVAKFIGEIDDNCNNIWVKWAQNSILGRCNIWNARDSEYASWAWRTVLRIQDLLARQKLNLTSDEWDNLWTLKPIKTTTQCLYDL